LVIDEQAHGEHRSAVGAQGHEPGVGTGELAHIAVDHIQAQGEHDGDQGELENEGAVVADFRPQMKGCVKATQGGRLP